MIIAGAGGHAREIRDILDIQGVNDLCFFDNINDPLPEVIRDERVILSEADLIRIIANDPLFILGTGGPNARRTLYGLFIQNGGKPVTCVAPTAIISKRAVEIGDGCNIMHRVFISNHVNIGKGSLLNAGVQIHHDVWIGSFCEIGPGAIILGKVKIGNDVFIGSGAIIFPGTQIGDGAIIGAGTVVAKSVDNNAKVVGNLPR